MTKEMELKEYIGKVLGYVWTTSEGEIRQEVAKLLYSHPVMQEGKEEKHYLIIGKYTKTAIGCCFEDGKDDVLSEEPGSTFQEQERSSCPICNEDNARLPVDDEQQEKDLFLIPIPEGSNTLTYKNTEELPPSKPSEYLGAHSSNIV